MQKIISQWYISKKICLMKIFKRFSCCFPIIQERASCQTTPVFTLQSCGTLSHSYSCRPSWPLLSWGQSIQLQTIVAIALMRWVNTAADHCGHYSHDDSQHSCWPQWPLLSWWQSTQLLATVTIALMMTVNTAAFHTGHCSHDGSQYSCWPQWPLLSWWQSIANQFTHQNNIFSIA